MNSDDDATPVVHDWLSNHDERLDRAGFEIRELKAQADAVITRLARMDAAENAPAVVRRDTLNRVWTRLMDVGNVDGAVVVSRLREELDGMKYTADVVVVDPEGRVLMISRKRATAAVCWGLPGGHVDPGETSRDAAARELLEETGVRVDPAKLFRIGTFDKPGRDPRGLYSTDAYLARVPSGTVARAADDAAAVQWGQLRQLIKFHPDTIAFDHQEILRSALELVHPSA